MDEASQKWTHLYENDLEPDMPGLSLQKAKFAMGLADHRYLAALARLHQLLERSRVLTRLQFWGLVVGGFVLGSFRPFTLSSAITTEMNRPAALPRKTGRVKI